MKSVDMPSDLHEKKFSINGTVDMLTGIHNLLTWAFANRKKIEAVFPDGYTVFECNHCVASMKALLMIIEDTIQRAMVDTIKEQKHEKRPSN